MSLLDNPPHTWTVQPRKKTTDAAGSFGVLVADGPPVTIRGAAQPVREWSAAEEIPVHGIQMLSLLRFIARNWVGDTNALITFRGYHWEVVGDPEHMNMSPTTAHWEITARRVEQADTGDDT